MRWELPRKIKKHRGGFNPRQAILCARDMKNITQDQWNNFFINFAEEIVDPGCPVVKMLIKTKYRK